MKVLSVLAVAMSATLASCVTTSSESAQQKAAIAYDNICAVEPTVYLAYMAYTARKPVKESIAKKIDAGHAVVMQLCQDRPTDLIAGLASLVRAYATVAAAPQV